MTDNAATAHHFSDYQVRSFTLIESLPALIRNALQSFSKIRLAPGITRFRWAPCDGKFCDGGPMLQHFWTDLGKMPCHIPVNFKSFVGQPDCWRHDLRQWHRTIPLLESDQAIDTTRHTTGKKRVTRKVIVYIPSFIKVHVTVGFGRSFFTVIKGYDFTIREPHYCKSTTPQITC